MRLAMATSKAQERRKARQLEQLARIRGQERKLHFENGGSLVEWRGGTRTITKNKKREASRNACRKWRS